MYPTVSIAYPCHRYQPLGSGVDQPTKITSRENARSNRLTAHSDQASQAEARVPILPIPRPCSFAPSVTTPLYSTTVFQALRQPLRSRAVNELLRTPLPRLSGKSLEGSRAFMLMVLKAAKWHLWPRLDLLWEPRVELIRNFQTVSLACLLTAEDPARGSKPVS